MSYERRSNTKSNRLFTRLVDVESYGYTFVYTDNQLFNWTTLIWKSYLWMVMQRTCLFIPSILTTDVATWHSSSKNHFERLY